MDQIPCPGCRTPLDAEVTCCPICLRPRTKYEITRAYSHLREDASRRRKRPFFAAGWLLLAGAAGYGVWRWRAPLLGAFESARAKVYGFADYSMDARNLIPKTAEPAAGPSTAVAAPAPAAPPFTTPPPAPGAVAKPAPAPAAAMPPTSGPAAAEAPAVKREELRMPIINPAFQWTMFGQAFDLTTLKPAARVQLVFQAGENGGTAATAMTDESGRYAAALPRAAQIGPLSLLVSDSRYVPTVLCESDIPYRTLTAEERRQMARSAQDGDIRPAALTDVSGEATQHRDLFLAPAR